VIVIYAPEITARLQYIAQTILTDGYGIPVAFVDQVEAMPTSDAVAKINYSKTVVINCYQIVPTTILSQTNVAVQNIEVVQADLPYFFATGNGQSHPFDLFAAAFYLVTRYEEYLPHELDIYQRFPHTSSIAFQHQFLKRPIVNEWTINLLQHLKQWFPAFEYKMPEAKWLPTYDIDVAYAIRGKSWWRNLGRAAIDLLKGYAFPLKYIWQVRLLGQKDPFDTYDWLDNLHQKNQLQPLYFMLMAAQQSGYDKNLSPDSPTMQALLGQLAAKYSLGIHPSCASHGSKAILQAEHQSLKDYTKKAANISRQHYVQMRLPHTYEQLLALGITDDYSMGYGSINGYRAGIAHSFLWFNLASNQSTALHIHPFCYMEANSLFEEKENTQQALETAKQYWQQHQQVGGTMITIWHNHSLSDSGIFKGWKAVYEQFIQFVLQSK
jgi:hypothetical protein